MGSVTPYSTSEGKRYRVRYRTPDRRQTDKRGFKTKREAEDFLASMEVSKLRGEWVDASLSKITVREWSSSWYSAQEHLKPTTLAGYRHALDKHVLPKWGSYPLPAVSHADVQSWVNDLASGLSPSTVRQTHLVLSGLLKYAVRDGRLAKNPSDGIRLPRLQQRSRGYLNHDQAQRLALKAGTQFDVVLLLSYTGLRWGELAALRVQSVDFDRHRLEISEAVTEPRGTIVWGSPKSHERRSVPFPEFLDSVLRGRMRGKTDADILFDNNGQVFRNASFRRRFFDRAVEEMRLEDPRFPRVTPHDLRHTAASLAVSAGANVKAVQRMLGHASAAMTLDVYADLFDDDLDAVGEALNEQAKSAFVGKMWAPKAVEGL
jgi:integrase